MKMAVLFRATAVDTMAGKSNFSILWSTRLKIALMLSKSILDRSFRNVNKIYNADTIIVKKINYPPKELRLAQKHCNHLRENKLIARSLIAP